MPHLSLSHRLDSVSLVILLSLLIFYSFYFCPPHFFYVPLAALYTHSRPILPSNWLRSERRILLFVVLCIDSTPSPPSILRRRRRPTPTPSSLLLDIRFATDLLHRRRRRLPCPVLSSRVVLSLPWNIIASPFRPYYLPARSTYPRTRVRPPPFTYVHLWFAGLTISYFHFLFSECILTCLHLSSALLKKEKEFDLINKAIRILATPSYLPTVTWIVICFRLTCTVFSGIVSSFLSFLSLYRFYHPLFFSPFSFLFFL